MGKIGWVGRLGKVRWASRAGAYAGTAASILAGRGVSVVRKNIDAKRAGEVSGIALGADPRRQFADRQALMRGDFLERFPEFRFERNARAVSVNKNGMIFHFRTTSPSR